MYIPYTLYTLKRIILFENPLHTLNPRVDADKDCSKFWGFLLFQSVSVSPPTCQIHWQCEWLVIAESCWAWWHQHDIVNKALSVQHATILSRPLQQLYEWPIVLLSLCNAPFLLPLDSQQPWWCFPVIFLYEDSYTLSVKFQFPCCQATDSWCISLDSW